MWVSFLQKSLLLFFSCKVVLQAHCLTVKRSPLELGYATFPNEIVKHKHVPIVSKITEEEDIDKDGDNPISSGVNKVRHTQEWVPGRVKSATIPSYQLISIIFTCPY
ncbi:uncharacterized protein LOC108903254 isoform X2 [Anoplophora glabripennis]|uniref:uncharacterized protein LOC108903254 isoform X2 n=1 Tax=Anoplophora glabripennis TaxID=217634 RepID=UPI000875A197|nr:uncharacterized protein LOC108903254 isoform X2 [Anoplophora glabripennis]